MGYTQERLGKAVIFTDEVGKDHFAVITADWSTDHSPLGGVNLVFVSSDDGLTDPYGRQIVRKTSVTHQSNQSAPGYFWRDL